MMKNLELVVEGKQLPLGKRIGRGGEGDVYLIADGSNRAVKFYTVSDPTSRESKIRAMVEQRLAGTSSLVAFPLAVASSREGKFAGFLMNLVVGHKPLFEIYSPGARKKNFPRADYRFLVRAAANIARAVGAVHNANCVIGDINHSGILVSDKAIAALIDADSFQFSDGRQQFYCKVGVPEYTPPELQGKKLSETLRTQQHDAFGLAIVIFQMLCMGRHPFVGTYSQGEMPIERAIREYRFAYSTVRSVGMTPPPGAVRLTDFPQEIAEAFEAAFSQNKTRPTAERWISLLTDLEQSLQQCSANNLHYYPSSAPECIWCRMEKTLGITLFIPDFSHVKLAATSFAQDSVNLAALWATIEAVPVIANIAPVLPTYDPKASVDAEVCQNEEQIVKVVGIVITVLCIGLQVCFPNLYFIWGSLGLFAIYKLSTRSPRVLDLETRLNDYTQNWDQAVTKWQAKCGLAELHALKKNLINAKHSYEQLAQERAHKISVYQTSRHEDQLMRYLESFPIRTAKVKGIGPARQAALASYGIDTAAECTWENLLKVPGFGPKNSVPLTTWRDKLKSKFVFSDNLTDADRYQMQMIDFEIQTKTVQLKKLLLSGAANLTALSNKVRTLSAMPDPEIIRLYKIRCQLEADLKYLGIDPSKLAIAASAKRKKPVAISPPSIPAVSERDVFGFFGVTYSTDGNTLQRKNQVISCALDYQNSAVRGRVQGINPQPFNVSVVLDEKHSHHIKAANCTCQFRNSCEHSAALLLHAIRTGVII